jgi:catechol 2,3-dioxygenase-like lactoylglutathione lyase family enzyme
MLTALDHIIIGVTDLEQATNIFSQKLGLAISGGGIHPSGGTANRIIVIGDTYLELITVRTPAEAQQSMLERQTRGDGYLNFVLSSNDIEADTAAMARRGVSVIGPTSGQLKAPDGHTRGWSRTDVERPDLTQHYPFVIQHDSTGEERRFRLAGWSEPPKHPLGAMKVLSATIAVADLSEAARRFAHIYGLPATEAFTGDVDAWEAMLVAFPLVESGQSFELAEPLPLADPYPTYPTYPVAPVGARFTLARLPEPGALSAHLQTFGESLCRMTLAVENLAESRSFLDEHEVTYMYDRYDRYDRRGEGEPRPVLWILPDQACGAAIVLHEATT